jgi:hypothetical protein
MDNNEELLNYIYETAKMGSESTLTLVKAIEDKNNKIKDIVNDIYKSYLDFTHKSEKLLKEESQKPNKPKILASVGADLGIKMNMLEDNSDSAIAEMLIRGLTMGEIEMTKKIDAFDNSVSSDMRSLAKDFKDFQANAIVKLKKYL